MLIKTESGEKIDLSEVSKISIRCEVVAVVNGVEIILKKDLTSREARATMDKIEESLGGVIHMPSD